jgi:hypothetical protein
VRPSCPQGPTPAGAEGTEPGRRSRIGGVTYRTGRDRKWQDGRPGRAFDGRKLGSSAFRRRFAWRNAGGRAVLPGFFGRMAGGRAFRETPGAWKVPEGRAPGSRPGRARRH